jgi:hypothetical protein
MEVLMFWKAVEFIVRVDRPMPRIMLAFRPEWYEELWGYGGAGT